MGDRSKWGKTAQGADTDSGGAGGQSDDGQGIDLSEFDTSVTSFFSSTYKSIVTAISWLLYGLHQDTSISFTLALFLLTLETIQWFSFAFFENVQFPWNREWSNWFVHVTYYSSNFMGLSTIGLLAAYAWILCIPLSGAFAIYAKNSLKWSWPTTLLRIFATSSITFMFLPVTGAILRLIFGCLQENSSEKPHFFYGNDITCGSTFYVILTVVGSFAIVFYGLFCAIVVACFFEMNPNQRLDLGDKLSATSRSSARGELFNLVARLLLQFIFIIFSQFSLHRWPLGFAILIVGLALTYFYYTHMPYYHLTMQAAYLSQACLIAWVGCCLFVTNVRGEAYRGPLYLLYIGSPCIIASAIFAVRARIDDLLFWGSDKLVKPHLVELKARVVMMEGIRQYSLDEQWVKHNSDREEQHKSLRATVESIFKIGIERFPHDALLHLHFSSFYLFHENNKPLAYRELTAAEMCRLSFDVQFLVFLFRTRAELETNWIHSQDVQSYIEFKECKQAADSAARFAARSMFEFWSELIRATPNIERMIRLSTVSRQAVIQTQSNFEKLLIINGNSVPVLRAYGGFVLDFNGDLSTSSQMLNRADELEDARQSIVFAESSELRFLDPHKTNLDIFDERNAVLGISIESADFARIISVNAASRHMFGYSLNTELLGHNINMIMPEPISSEHDAILERFLARNYSSIMSTTRLVVGVDKSGALLPCNLNIRWADSSASRIIGVLAPFYSDDEQLMYDQDTGYVTYCTPEAYQLLQITREMLLAKEVQISKLFPHLSTDRAKTGREKQLRDQLLAQASEREGALIVVRQVKDGRMAVARLWMYSAKLAKKSAHFIRFSLKVDPEHLCGPMNVLGFTDAELRGEGVLLLEQEDMFSELVALRTANESKGGVLSSSQAVPLKRSGNTTTPGLSSKEIARIEGVQVSNIQDLQDRSGSSSKIATDFFGDQAGAGSVDEKKTLLSSKSALSSAQPDYSSPASMKINGPSPQLGSDEDEESNSEDSESDALTHLTVDDDEAADVVHGAFPSALAAEKAALATQRQLLTRLASSANLRAAGGMQESLVSGSTGVHTSHLHQPHFSYSGDSGAVPFKPMSGGGKTKAQLRLEMSISALGLGAPGAARREPNDVRSVATKTLGGGRGSGGDDKHSIVTGKSAGTDSTGASSGDSLDSSVGTMTNRNISLFLRDRADHTDKKLSRARKVAFVMTILMFGAWLALYMLTTAALEETDLSTDLLLLACHRYHVSLTIATNADELELCNMGMFNEASCNAARDRLGMNVRILEALEGTLYNERYLSANVQRHVYTPNVNFSRIVSGVPVYRTFNLREMAEVFISSGDRVVEAHISELNSTTFAPLYDLLNNGFSTVPTSFRAAIDFFKTELDAAYAGVWVWEIVIYGIVSVLCVLGAVFELAGPIKTSEADAHVLIMLFLSLPRAVLKAMQRRFSIALRNQGEEEEEEIVGGRERRAGRFDSEDDDNFSDTSGDTSLTSQTDEHYSNASSQYRDQASSVGGGSHHGPSQDANAAGSSTSAAKQGALARFRVSDLRQQSLRSMIRRQRIVMGLRICLMIGIILSYLIVSIYEANESYQLTLKTSDDLQSSTERQSSLVVSRYHIRRFMIDAPASSLEAGLNRLDRAMEYNRAVLYGNSTLGLTGDPDPTQLQFQFRNGCADISLDVLPEVVRQDFAKHCATYRGGMNVKGAQETFLTTIVFAQQLATESFSNVLAASLNNPNVTVPYPVTSDFFLTARELLEEYQVMSRVYAEPMMLYATHLYRIDAEQNMIAYTAFRQSFIIGACIVLFFAHIFIFNPIFSQLFERFKSSAAMLLMFPPDVVMKVPHVAKFVQEYNRRSGGTDDEADPLK